MSDELRKAAEAALIELDLIRPQSMGAHVYRAREDLRAALAAAQPPAAMAGWQWVPVEWTEEMQRSAADAWHGSLTQSEWWSAAIAAAPTAQAQSVPATGAQPEPKD